jgi:hypothetical protein
MRKLLILILLSNYSFSVFSQNFIDVEINYNRIDLISSYSAGVTHTQNTCDSWNNPGAVNDARILLENSTDFQNQHLMGWGCLNPWPDSTITRSADWDWKTLDARIKLIRETNGKAIITLCGCPTWMHTPSSNGMTEWGSSLEKAPTTVHFDDFAHLAAEVARRYHDVIYFQVWNELKGFWNSSLNRWRYEDYTTMYNIVYDSLKNVNPQIKVGGPYTVVSTYSEKKYFTVDTGGVYGYFDKRPLDVIVYWLEQKKGADFLAVDGKINNKDEILNCDIFKAADKFRDIVTWIKQKTERDNPMEIWWSEWYAVPGNYGPQDNNFNNSLMASALIKTIKAGSSKVLIWQPEGDDQGLSFPSGLWTSTRNSGGGKPTPYYYTSKILKENFSYGTGIVNSNTSSGDITVIASVKKVLIVNHKSKSCEIRINQDTLISLEPYEVKLINATTSSTTEPEINIYYSVTDGFLHLKNLKPEPEDLKYSIFNQLGCMLKSGNEVATSEYSIDLSMFRTGIYIFRILYMNKFFSDKIVIIR